MSWRRARSKVLYLSSAPPTLRSACTKLQDSPSHTSGENSFLMVSLSYRALYFIPPFLPYGLHRTRTSARIAKRHQGPGLGQCLLVLLSPMCQHLRLALFLTWLLSFGGLGIDSSHQTRLGRWRSPTLFTGLQYGYFADRVHQLRPPGPWVNT